MKPVHTSLYALIITILIFLASCIGDEPALDLSQPQLQDTIYVDFWNGNRSQPRQIYERKVLTAVLEVTEPGFGPWKIEESIDEYPGDEEALVFSEKGHDLFVTIAGNQKFDEDDMIVIPEPMTKNLLGYRIPIIRKDNEAIFNEINEPADIQKLRHGIPLTWSDAVIFRENGYEVVEDGSFDDIFDRLHDGLFDYSAYGANEVLGIYENRASKREGLMIDNNILLFYQFPLVFYVNPDLPELAERIESGMQKIIESGTLDEIFDAHYGDITDQLNLNERILFILDNPLIPNEFRDLKPNLNNL